MYKYATPNARCGGVGLRIYLVINALTLVSVCGLLWTLAARADSRGISPNTSLGFRSQSTLASLHGWYVAQRVGFHFAAIAATLVTVAASALVIVFYVRRVNPIWIVLIPAIAGIGIGVCMVVAGQRADKAAVSVVMPKADRADRVCGRMDEGSSPPRGLIEHTVFVDSGCRARLSSDVTQLTQVLHQALGAMAAGN